MWILLLLLSMVYTVPHVHADIGMTDMENPLALVVDFNNEAIDGMEGNFEVIGTSQGASLTPTICVSVLEDNNNDGLGDDPVAGVLVELCSVEGVPISSGYTGFSGMCCFSSMLAGLYKVKQTTLPGYIPVNYVDGWMNIDTILDNDMSKYFVIESLKPNPAPTKQPSTRKRPKSYPSPNPTLRHTGGDPTPMPSPKPPTLPTQKPSPNPTPVPTCGYPTPRPPTPEPTPDPSPYPTPETTGGDPTSMPTPGPTPLPTLDPSPYPTQRPTEGEPTPNPTRKPSQSPYPTPRPTEGHPTPNPTHKPNPSPNPTPRPTEGHPTRNPTPKPNPTPYPTPRPT